MGARAGRKPSAEVAGGSHQDRFLRFFTLAEPAAAELDMDLDGIIRAVLADPGLRRRFERLKRAAEVEASTQQHSRAEQAEEVLESAADEAALRALDEAQREMANEASVAVETELEMRAEWEVRRAMAELALQSEGEPAGREEGAGPLSEADLDIRHELSMLQSACTVTQACTLIDAVVESAIEEVAGPRRGFLFANALPSPLK